MKRVCFIFLILLVSFSLFAGKVPVKDAEKVARSHYFQGKGSFTKGNNPIKWEDINLSLQSEPTKDSQFQFYIFNVNNDEGFVIVSSESSIQPILAYSFEGSYNAKNMSPGQDMFLQYYSNCMELAAQNEIEVSEDIYNEWQELLEYNPTKSFTPKSTSDVLLGEILWNQNWPYNAMCPAHTNSPNGYGGHVPVGCVATAMGMVMKYHNWPPSGQGAKTHSNYQNGGFGNITINFANETYNWDIIPDYASSDVNDELAKINYHMGVSVNMYWHPDGSGTQSHYVSSALKNNFKYSSNVAFVEKSDYTDSQWKAMLKEQINSKMPMYYAGASTSTGHAWVCDGYQGDLFHMNWGWGKNGGNGFYALDNLISTATSGGEESNFRYGQEAIINIAPNSEFSPSCVGAKTIIGIEGTLDDGSSLYDYSPNSNCVYVIKPECGMVVTGKFTKFDLAGGDVVNLYAGDENSDVLLASFDAENLPGDQVITSYKGALTIRFNTDETLNGNGWKLKYNVTPCTAEKPPVYTTASGSFGDGSGICGYEPANNCSWRIAPEGASKITISFSDFDLGSSVDWVRVYKDTILPSNKIVEYKLANLPSNEIIVNSGVAYVMFYTGSASTGGPGWNLSYTSDGENHAPDYSIISELSISPNPGNVNSELSFSLGKSSEARIFVTNTLGQIVYDKTERFNIGDNNFSLSNILETNIKNGMYNINIQADGQIRTIKFVAVN
jgi:hypothetical protein